MSEQNYIKRYPKGPYDLRFLRGQGKFVCQVYVDNVREDVLGHASLDELERKVDRYLAGEAMTGELKSAKDELNKAREEVAALTKSLTSISDSNARAAVLEKELDDARKKQRDYDLKLAQAEADIEQYKNELEAAKKVKNKSADAGDKKS